MMRLAGFLAFLFLVFSLDSCQTNKKQQDAPVAETAAKDPRAVTPGTFEGDYELLWKDDGENNSTSLYQVNAESMVFGEDILYYITGPKEPEGGSFSQIKALDLKNRKLKWSRKFVTQHLTKIDVANDLIIFSGLQGFGDMFEGYNFVFALHAGTGELAWKTKIENQPYGGGLLDFAVDKDVVYLLCEGKSEKEEDQMALLTLATKTGEIMNAFPIRRDLSFDIGIFDAPFFLTKPKPESFKKELVTPNGNLILIGREMVQKVVQNVTHGRMAETVMAVSGKNGDIAWHYHDPLENFNSIAGWQVDHNAQIIHFHKPLNAAGQTGLDLTTGKEVAANPANLTVKYGHKRPQAGTNKEQYLEVNQKRAAYKVKYRDEDVFVYEKVNR